MIRMSIAEQFEALEKIITSNVFSLLICISFIIIALILLNAQKLNREMVIKSCVVVYIMVMICLIVEYRKTFSGILDYLINNVFFKLLFPSLITYIITVIIANIIIVWSLFSKRIKKVLRKINVVVFCFLSLILFLVLNTIQANNIDVYSSSAVYTNKDLFVLIELNMGIFITWLIGLLIYKLIKKKLKPDFALEPVNFETNIEDYSKENIVSNKYIPNLGTINNIDNNAKKELEYKATKNNLNVSLNDYATNFTLDEYKMISNLLKERKN